MKAWKVLAAACLISAGATAAHTYAPVKAPPVEAMPGMALGGAFPDTCNRMEGYASFRSRLADAVKRRDEAAFRALFAEKGFMRPLNVRGGPWNISAGELDALWGDLDLILTLGCTVDKDKLILPATADAVEDFEAMGVKVAVRETPVRATPADDAPILAMAPRGALLRQFEYPEHPKDGWEYFRLADGRSGFAKEQDLRSTLDTAVVAVRERGEWRIEYYGGYD